jgi:hypothetical protein
MFFGAEPEVKISTKFKVTGKVNLLGFNIDKDVSNLTDNFCKVKKNLQNIVNFWDRFTLTLPGRITVAKTFMLSQINYCGSIITPDPETLQWMQNLIDNFCLKNLQFAKKKLYLPPAGGGVRPY